MPEAINMMFARAVLIIPGAIFFIYGAMCWYNPELPAEYAGLWVAHQDGLAELAAMYGGLQLCLGSIIFLSGILKGYLRPGLWLLMMVLGGLVASLLKKCLARAHSYQFTAFRPAV